MISTGRQAHIAMDYISGLGRGEIDLGHLAEDMTAWSPAMRMVSRNEFLPRLPVMSKVFMTPLTFTFDSITAQPGRVAVQCRSHGVLYNGEVYSNEYLFLIEFNDEGRISHAREYFDIDRLRDILKPAIAAWHAMHAI